MENIGLLLISSDRGLAGPYNMNVTKAALEFAQGKSQTLRWVTVGQKGRDLAYARGANIVSDFSSFKSSPSFSDVTPIARVLILSVRPPIWVGPDWIRLFVHLAGRLSADLGWTGLDQACYPRSHLVQFQRAPCSKAC